MISGTLSLPFLAHRTLFPFRRRHRSYSHRDGSRAAGAARRPPPWPKQRPLVLPAYQLLGVVGPNPSMWMWTSMSMSVHDSQARRQRCRRVKNARSLVPPRERAVAPHWQSPEQVAGW